MKKHSLFLIIVLLLVPYSVFAKDKPSGNSDKEDAEMQPREEQEEEAEKVDTGDRIEGFTLVPKFGYGFYGEGKGDWDDLTNNQLESRHSLVVSLSFDFGGDGLGWELAPYYANENGDVSMHVLGIHSAIVYRWHAGYWYPHLGIGTKGGYIFGDQIDGGMELYGRIPVGFSYYFIDSLAFMCELGLGYGITGIDPTSDSTTFFFEDFKIGHGFYMDLLVGFRFP